MFSLTDTSQQTVLNIIYYYYRASGLDSIINIVRARWLIIRSRCQIQSWCSSFQHPPCLLCFWLEMDILMTLLGGAQVDIVEPPGLITSLLTLACLWPIHFLWHKIIRSGGQSLRPQRLCIP